MPNGPLYTFIRAHLAVYSRGASLDVNKNTRLHKLTSNTMCKCGSASALEVHFFIENRGLIAPRRGGGRHTYYVVLVVY